MKRLIEILCFVFFASFLLYPSGAFAQNKLVNVDFETGNINGWNTWAVTDQVSDGVNHTPEGRYSANPSLNAENGPFEMGALIQEFEDIAPGRTINASAWIKTEDLKGPDGSNVYAILKIEFWSGDAIIGTKETGRFNGTNDWQKATILTTIPEGTTKVKYLLMLWNDGGKGSSGNAYFDDVSMIVSE